MCIDILLANHRQAILVDTLVEALHLAWNDSNLAHHLCLHCLGISLLLVALAQHLAIGKYGHMLLSLQLGNTTLFGYKRLYVGLNTARDIRSICLNRVDKRLII